MKTDKSQTIAYLQTNYAPYESVRIVTRGARKKKKDGSFKWVPADKGEIYEVEKLLYDLHTSERLEDVIKSFNPQVGAWISANPTKGASDEDVTDYRAFVIEADDIPKEKQLELFNSLKVPYRTLTDSGKRSIHGIVWIDGPTNKDQYEDAYASLLKDLTTKGFPMDPANKNPGRLTRLPGCTREEGFQSLLATNPQAEILPYVPKKDTPSKPENVDESGTKVRTRTRKPLGTPEEIVKACIEALKFIDPVGIDRDLWYRLSVAFQNVGGGFEDWYAWCMRDPERAIDLEKEWKKLASKNYKGRKLTEWCIFWWAKYYNPSFNYKDYFPNAPEESFNYIEEGNFCIQVLHAVKLDKKEFYIYSDKGFINDPSIIMSEIGELYMEDRQRPHVISELFQYMQIYAPSIQEADKKFVQFQNGILDTESREFIPLTPSLFIKQSIPWNYNPQAAPVEIVDRVLNEWFCGDEDSKTLFLEWAGYQMLRFTPIASFMLFIGPKRNGKSVGCDWIRELVGYQNSSAVPMRALEERFKTAVFFDKLSNVADENKGTYMPEISLLKAVSAGGYIDVEPKGRDSFTARCTTKMTFAFNESFKVDDRCGALKERMNVLLFTADFSDRSKQDHSLLYNLTKPEAMEYFISLAVNALWGVLDRGRFTAPAQSVAWIEEQDLINNPFKRFIKETEEAQQAFTTEGEVLEGPDLWTKYPATMIYHAYCAWCLENGLEPLTQTAFGKEIQKALNLQSYRPSHKKPTHYKYRY